MRMTSNRRRILAALQCRDHLEHGTPPYSAATVASIIGAPDVNNVARTLRQLAACGLVERVEGYPVPVWCDIQGKHYDRRQTAYWNTSSKEADQQAADEWKAGAGARSDAVLDSFTRWLRS